MPTLQDLITEGYSGSPMTDAARERMQQLLMTRARNEIERQSGNQARAINENTFGRGLGLSSVSAQLQAENNRLRETTLTKADIDAEVAARQAQMSALGQAASYALGDRARALAERGQAAGERQFGQNLKSQQSMNRMNMVGGGLGALAGGGMQAAGNIWGKQIREALAGTPGAPGAGGVPGAGGPGGTADVLRPEGPTSPEALAAPTYQMPEMPNTELPQSSWPTDTGPDMSGMQDWGSLPSSAGDFTFPDWTQGMSGLEGLIQPNWQDLWGS